MEQWKVIKESISYEISSYGNVKSLKRKQPVILKPSHQKGGYLKVCLWSKKGLKTRQIHRLVAEAFIPKLNGKLFVNHKDCNKKNNHVENLEWCTVKENITHAILNGLNTNPPKPIRQFNLKGDFIKKWSSIQEAADALNIYQSNIVHFLRPNKRRCKHPRHCAGFLWTYN